VSDDILFPTAVRPIYHGLHSYSWLEILDGRQRPAGVEKNLASCVWRSCSNERIHLLIYFPLKRISPDPDLGPFRNCNDTEPDAKDVVVSGPDCVCPQIGLS
jgi:hypothetical protein